MKGFIKHLVCFVLVAALVVPMAFSGKTVSAAKQPTLSKTSKTITGIGTVYTLTVKNQPKNTTLTYSSSNPKVATVNGLGHVTAVAKGKTNIACTITYKNKDKMKLTCKVTVKVPATAVTINNAKLVNNAQEMIVGEKYDFNRTLTPKGSSDKTYWTIEDEDIASVNSQGVVTALKEGYTRLIARSGATKTAANSPLNEVTDAIIIHVTKPIAKVESCKVDGKDVTITFTQPMLKSSLMDAMNNLNTSNVIIEGKKNKNDNNKLAADLGKITPALSSDGKVLTLTATNYWDGIYNISIKSDVQTQSGMAFAGYNEELDFCDTKQADLINTTVDESGVVVLFHYNKEIDISGMKVAITGSTDSTLSQAARSVILNTGNYVLQADKKTIQLDLSTLSSSDHNKYIELDIYGIKDSRGNMPKDYHEYVSFRTDNSLKPNATVSYAERINRNTIRIHFSKAIQYPGYITINSEASYGSVSKDDKTCADYKIQYTNNLNATGMLTGTVSGWLSYNASSSGNSTNFVVDMSTGNGVPVLINHEIVSTLNNDKVVNAIVLTYNKNVKLLSTKGYVYGSFRDKSSNVYQTVMQYTATVKDNVVTLVLDPNTSIGEGTYTLTLDAGFVSDLFDNTSQKQTFDMQSTTVTSSVLPEPKAITQNVNNPSILTIDFANKLDLASAENPLNYSIDNVYPISARVTTNSSAGASVELTFPSGTIRSTSEYPVYVTNIAGHAGSFQPMSRYCKLMELKENEAPVCQKAKLTSSSIILYFSETIQGVPAFDVYYGNTLVNLNSSNSCVIQGNMVVISLASSAFYPNNLTVSPSSGCVITDLAGNKANLASRIYVELQ